MKKSKTEKDAVSIALHFPEIFPDIRLVKEAASCAAGLLSKINYISFSFVYGSVYIKNIPGKYFPSIHFKQDISFTDENIKNIWILLRYNYTIREGGKQMPAIYPHLQLQTFPKRPL